MEGSVLSIFITPKAGEPMSGVVQTWAMAGQGLAGDRYMSGQGAFSKSDRPVKRHVTLIAAEDIADANRGSDSPFRIEETRRNIVTVGIPLAPLVGRVFFIGKAALRGVEPCDPCDRPSKLCGRPGFRTQFAGRGGIRAEILTSGLVTIGDTVRTCGGRFGESPSCDEYHAHGLDCGDGADICLDCGFTNADHVRVSW